MAISEEKFLNKVKISSSNSYAGIINSTSLLKDILLILVCICLLLQVGIVGVGILL